MDVEQMRRRYRLFGQLRVHWQLEVICSQKVPRSLARTINQPSTSPGQEALSSCLLFVIKCNCNEAEYKVSLELIHPLYCSSKYFHNRGSFNRKKYEPALLRRGNSMRCTEISCIFLLRALLISSLTLY